MLNNVMVSAPKKEQVTLKENQLFSKEFKAVKVR
jgi:hypothetical protein